ncbi:ZIP family metal transporter [Halosegnis sp.]|uniref:ZIP family metal transporter n=1 Tax=Halosegnis sp. TaxID=2864959 RepID=UPI0035D4B2F2
MFADQFVSLVGPDPVVQALVAGLVIAGLNTLGALVVLVWRAPTERGLDTALGFAAGVMLSASFTSLLLPGIDIASAPDYPALAVGEFALVGILPVLIGFTLGVVALDLADAWMPGVQQVITGRKLEDEDAGISAVLLFIVAITLHNMPEGLAVGVGFGSGDVGAGLALMVAIGLQNVPEGLAVSVAAVNAGLGSRFYAGVAGIRAGLVEIPLTVFGAAVVGVAAPVVPYAMGFAAGGMLFVIFHEIVPQTHSRGHEHEATVGLMVGLVVMLTLDVVLAA